MPLFDDTSFDFDFSDYSDFSIPDINLGNFDWGNVDLGLGDLDLSNLGSLDLSNLENFGFDLSDLGNVDLSNVGSLLNWGVDVGLDTTFDPFEVDGFQGSRTEDTVFNELPFSTDNSGDVENQPGGFYGNTPNATYDPKTNLTTIRDNAGNIIRTIQGPSTTTPGTNTINEILKTVTQFVGNKDNAALMAMLGGLLGLLGRSSTPKLPAGYKGSIPKYTATRVPGRGVEYTRAAGGGLMDLAAGGRPARYLRGGTDGMADKIKTDIDGKQPARLSHGEFVIPADVVSHLGNGNSDAGADVLYDMMDKVRKARTGTTKQGKQINPRKMIPA
jgi:hypothetical protein